MIFDSQSYYISIKYLAKLLTRHLVTILERVFGTHLQIFDQNSDPLAVYPKFFKSVVYD